MAGLLNNRPTAPTARFADLQGMPEAFRQLMAAQFRVPPGQALGLSMQMPPTSNVPPVFQPMRLGSGTTFQLHAAPTPETMALIKMALMPPPILGVPMETLRARGMTGLPVQPVPLPPSAPTEG